MRETDTLDELIKKYSEDLIRVYGKSEPDIKEQTVIAEKKEETSVPKEKREESGTPSNELSGTASFTAAVRTGSGAFPVPGAKVIVEKDGSIVAFLLTDENGDSDKILLPAYSEEASLSADTARTVSYSADIFAEGFQEKRGLPVEASGSAEIILNVELTPTEERTE